MVMEKKFMGLSWCLGLPGLLILVSTANSVHAMTCQEAIVALMPCKPFLTSPAPSTTLACCSAVANVNAAASTTQSRRELCECFEKNVPAYGSSLRKLSSFLRCVQSTFPCPLIFLSIARTSKTQWSYAADAKNKA